MGANPRDRAIQSFGIVPAGSPQVKLPFSDCEEKLQIAEDPVYLRGTGLAVRDRELQNHTHMRTMRLDTLSSAL